MTATRATGTTTTRRPPSGSANTSPDPRSRTVAAPGVRRLACYGWVQEQAGSVASAIDFHANRQQVPPPASLNGPSHLVSGGPRLFERYVPDSIRADIVEAIEARRVDPAPASHRTRAAAEASFSASAVGDRLHDIVADAVENHSERETAA